jgi:hypothetical protein
MIGQVPKSRRPSKSHQSESEAGLQAMIGSYTQKPLHQTPPARNL